MLQQKISFNTFLAFTAIFLLFSCSEGEKSKDVEPIYSNPQMSEGEEDVLLFSEVKDDMGSLNANKISAPESWEPHFDDFSDTAFYEVSSTGDYYEIYTFDNAGDVPQPYDWKTWHSDGSCYGSSREQCDIKVMDKCDDDGQCIIIVCKDDVE